MEKPYEVGKSSDGTYIYAHLFREPYTLDLALDVAKELTNIGETPGVVGCLIDIRGTTSVSSVVDKYKFAHEKTKVAGLPYIWKYAFLIDPGDDSPNFIETVMINAGYMFRVFKDEQEAIFWLKGSQLDKPIDSK